MERKRARFHGSDQVETGGQCRVIRLNLEPGSLYLSETSSKGRIIIGGTPRETLSSNFAGEGRNSATLTRLARVLRCPAKCCSITRRIPVEIQSLRGDVGISKKTVVDFVKQRQLVD